jgi:acetyltransferase-like isoleucine patch superfamily enzyme
MSPDTSIESPKKTIGKDVIIGNDVLIQADEVKIGDGVSIGSKDDAEAFRIPGGVRIKARTLEINAGTSISRSVLINGKDIVLGRNVVFREFCTIDVRSRLAIGDGSYLNPYCRVMGRDIEFGRNFRMLTWASIGGGSCFDVHSRLRIGNEGHLGEFSFINTADEVTIGNEVGIGMRSAIFTHGAYQSFLKGYPVTFGPVTIEDNCWLPQAIVLPNVRIGRGTVVATGSLVNRDLPPFSLAAGIPAKVLRENAFSESLDELTTEQLMNDFFTRLNEILLDIYGEDRSGRKCTGYSFGEGRCLWFFKFLEKTSIEKHDFQEGDVVIALTSEKGASARFSTGRGCLLTLDSQTIHGNQDEFASRVANQLRRYGVRLK